MVTLFYFASVREAIGLGEEHVALAPDVSTPREVAAWLAGRGGGYATAFANLAKLRCAVDQQMTALDAPIGEASEIAFFPPVTGG